MFKLAELFVQITGKDSDFRSKLAGIRSELDGFASKFGKFAIPLGVGVGIAGIASGLADAVGAAGDLNETVSKTETLLKGNAASAKKFADDMHNQFGTSKREILDATSAMYLMGKAAGKSDEEAVKFSETIVRLADDASSMLNSSFGEAMDKIRSGLRGEAEPLSAWNVFLDDATIKAKAAELGLRALNGELSAGQKITARAAVIIEKLGYTQGDHANTMGGYNNQLKEFNGRMDELKVTLGQAVLPLFNGLLKVANPVLQAIKGIADAAGELKDALTPAGNSVIAEFAANGGFNPFRLGSTVAAAAAFGANKPMGGLAAAGPAAAGVAGAAALDPRVAAAREVIAKEAEKEAAAKTLEAERLKQSIEKYHALEKKRDEAYARLFMPNAMIPTKGGAVFNDAFAGISARSEQAARATLVEMKSLAQAFVAMRLSGPASAASGAAGLAREGLERLEWRMTHQANAGVTDVDSFNRELQDAALNAARDSLQEQRNQTALLEGIKLGIHALGQARNITAVFGRR